MQFTKIFKSRTVLIAIAQTFIAVGLVVATEYQSEGAILILKSVLDIILRYDTETSIK